MANAQVWDAGAIDPAEVGRLEESIEVEVLPSAPAEPESADRSPASGGLRVGVWGRPYNRYGRR